MEEYFRKKISTNENLRSKKIFRHFFFLILVKLSKNNEHYCILLKDKFKFLFPWRNTAN